MKTETIYFNGHDQRKGFVTITYANDQEHRDHDKEANYKANLARKRRLNADSGKPRMSYILIHTKIPQIFDKFIMPRAERACALGALHVESGGSFCDDQPDWWNMERHFDVYDAEFYRISKCPKCIFPNTQSLTAMIHHLNDAHKESNKYIGNWLKKFDL